MNEATKAILDRLIQIGLDDGSVIIQVLRDHHNLRVFYSDGEYIVYSFSADIDNTLFSEICVYLSKGITSNRSLVSRLSKHFKKVKPI